MAYIKEYWNGREKRAEQARKHTKEMQKVYKDKIEESIRDTIIYDTYFVSNKNYSCNTNIIVELSDSISSIIKHVDKCKDKMAVLNFSSYKNPGGMFINGSKAQEECLCHESFLYNVLSQKNDFYEWNNQHKNKALYSNRALYSPNILFVKKSNDYLFKTEAMCFCDVITCAAPNKSAAQKYQNVSDEENTKVLRSRIKFVLDIAKDNYVDTLILGAYGCGVFGQDAKEVASIFKEYLNITHKCFKKVVFAIPNGRDGNLEAFKEVFNS